MPDRARPRLTAASGILADFDRQVEAANHGNGGEPDWRRWCDRLAGTLRSVITVAGDAITTRDEAVALNRECADLFDECLAAGVIVRGGRQ